MQLERGEHLGPYEIVSRVGAGGMGEVWRARDPRIGRDVAIKIIPRDFVRDPERLHRFEQEARAAGALNHPNLVTIFDIGNHEETPYIVMELLEGAPLRERLSDGSAPARLPVRKAVDYATQMANGLAVAHDHGIVHRDLKPENVFVTNDGRVKILDFGLAKLSSASADGASELRTAARDTSPGTVLGTVGYMSPEQVRGQQVDHRSDIFSLGAILYEMLSGGRAFRGDSAADAMSAILKDDPPELSGDGLQVAPALDRVVHRCLEKSRDERFHSAHDLAFALEAISGSSATSSRLEALGIAEKRPGLRTAALVVLALAAIAAAYLLGRRASSPMTAAAAAPHLTQLTYQKGVEFYPAISPDGNSIAFAAYTSPGVSDIFLQRVGGENAIDLTKEFAGSEIQPAFSPDGQQIAFRAGGDAPGIYVMGATGESWRRLTDFGFNPTWSPDGKEIVFATESIFGPTSRTTFSVLWRVDVGSGQKKKIEIDADAVQPNWSPHGKRIAFWGLPEGTGKRVLYTAPSGGGKAVALTDDDKFNWNPVWAPDGRSLYFVSNRGGAMNVWRLAIDEESGKALGEAVPVTTSGQWCGQLSVAQNGAIAYTAVSSSWSVLRYPIEQNPLRLAAPVTVLGGSRDLWQVVPSPDGQWLGIKAFDTQEDLFVARADGSGLRRLTNDRFKDREISWSHDSQKIFFFSDRSGRYDIWDVDRDGGNLEPVTRTRGDNPSNPYPSPDGRFVATAFITGNSSVLFDLTKPIEKRNAEPLPPVPTGGTFLPAAWSRSGRAILGQRVTEREAGDTFVYDTVNRRYEEVFPKGLPIGWLSEGTVVVLDPDSSLFAVDLATKARTKIATVSRDDQPLQVSADGRSIYTVRRVDEGDVWTLRLEPPTKGR
jgi:Tol biopolymer transport system component